MASQKQPKVIDTAIDIDDSDTEIIDDTEDLQTVQLDDNNDDDVDDAAEIELSGRDEGAGLRTVASRQRLHDKLLSDVEAFLANGGQIHQLASYVNSGTPKRHVNKFGNSSM